LIYRALGDHPAGARDWETLFYYAGASLLTPAFGTAHDLPTRLLTLTEALTGLGTIALLISYLPALYGGYSRREARLLTLDDPQGGRLTPVRVIATHSGDQDLDLLYRFFAEWELWTAEVLESHVSYPMLALFRSQHVGQSWITALGVVTDAATLTCAAVPGADRREPYFQYRRGRRAIHEIATRLHVPPSSMTGHGLSREGFDYAWGVLCELGLGLSGRAAIRLRGSLPGASRLPPGPARLLGPFSRGGRARGGGSRHHGRPGARPPCPLSLVRGLTVASFTVFASGIGIANTSAATPIRASGSVTSR
jgi:hypothetical protein